MNSVASRHAHDATAIWCYQSPGIITHQNDRMAKAQSASTGIVQGETAIECALRTLETEGGGIAALTAAMREGLGAGFVAAINMIRAAQGRVIVTGMGKSGHIGAKIASTL